MSGLGFNECENLMDAITKQRSLGDTGLVTENIHLTEETMGLLVDMPVGERHVWLYKVVLTRA